MKTVTTVLLAIFTTVLVFVGFGSRLSGRDEARNISTVTPSLYAPATARAVPVMNTGQNAYTDRGAVEATQLAPAEADDQSPVLVNCGPGSQTLVRQVWMNGQTVSQVDCVPTGRAAMGYSSMPVSYEPGIVRVPRTVRVQESGYYPAPRRVASRSHRSWQKTALVIGGSTAAGAGIGGAVGGKKGALIGAAVGGGVSTLWEAVKRH